MKMKAWTIVGIAWPTFSVPGICSSGTSPFSLKIDVVGAKEPMPSVSKKFVTKPIASPSGPGRAASASPPRAERTQATMNTAATRPRATKRIVLASSTLAQS